MNRSNPNLPPPFNEMPLAEPVADKEAMTKELESLPAWANQATSYIKVDGGRFYITFPQQYWEYSYGLSHVHNFVARLIEARFKDWKSFTVVRDGQPILGSVRA